MAEAPGSSSPSALSVVLIVKNGERYLDRVLRAARALSDDVVVIDSGSTDSTAAICAAHQARVIHQDWLGYGPQKRVAVAAARHDWVLNLDADEELNDAAIAAIRALGLTPSSDPRRAFQLRRRTFIGAREVRHGDWVPDHCLRLFHRTTANFNDASVHEAVEVQPGVAVRVLPGAIRHFSFTDLADIYRPAYARLKAARYRAAGRSAGAVVTLLRFWWGFVRCYVIRLGFLDGATGVIVAVSAGLNACQGLAMAAEPAEAADRP